MWAALGRDLAALHETDMGEFGWARPDTLRSALAAPDLVAVERFWGATLPRLADVIAAREELANAMDVLPSVFVHGDSHTGNIAVADESLIFLDWQMSGTGRPGADLSFLNVRAAPAGVTAPPELAAAYLRNRDVGPRALERALLAEEMAVYVFQWPPFAAYNTPAGVERVRQRASLLATRWFQEAYA
jgi:aminoglycoside phosphotransferase (APT) family kinase protein